MTEDEALMAKDYFRWSDNGVEGTMRLVKDLLFWLGENDSSNLLVILARAGRATWYIS
jgi:hypothetical protein